jgi:uncharacterized membrane protein
MSFLLPLHPRLVHFPIALGLVGAVTLILGLVLHRDQWIAYGRMSLLLGWFGLLLAAVTGLIDQSRATSTPAITDAINLHITVGVALIVIFGLILYWPLRNRRLLADPALRLPYIALLLAGAALIVLDGWLGGKLVYTLGVGVALH